MRVPQASCRGGEALTAGRAIPMPTFYYKKPQFVASIAAVTGGAAWLYPVRAMNAARPTRRSFLQGMGVQIDPEGAAAVAREAELEELTLSAADVDDARLTGKLQELNELLPGLVADRVVVRSGDAAHGAGG